MTCHPTEGGGSPTSLSGNYAIDADLPVPPLLRPDGNERHCTHLTLGQKSRDSHAFENAIIAGWFPHIIRLCKYRLYDEELIVHLADESGHGKAGVERSVLMLMTLPGCDPGHPSVRSRKEGSSYSEGGRNIAVINQDFLFGADGEKLERRRTRGREGRINAAFHLHFQLYSCLPESE